MHRVIAGTHKSSRVSRFVFRGRVKKLRFSKTNDPKIDNFFATKCYFHFSGNPPNITGNLIFYCNKRKKLMKISVIELLHGLFVYFGWVIGRMPKIMQNGPQTRSTPTSNERKKHGPRCCTGKQRIPSTDM